MVAKSFLICRGADRDIDDRGLGVAKAWGYIYIYSSAMRNAG